MTTALSTSSVGERLGFRVDGMDCASCVGKIETALGRLGESPTSPSTSPTRHWRFRATPPARRQRRTSPGRSVR
ncbi:heavy metal-associated domain-containing protein [Ensifer sp. LC163]|uniref:heavy-metal-associated domain-containing protein n=1 Tax=Ensifer sp. LC163 TaxID=1120652 RepID=UPI002A4E24F1|nr:heavy metal-associated domain-containing protein [Ensifer sp. LC163]